MLVEPAAHGTCFLGPQVQGLVLLALSDGEQGESEDQGLGASAVAKEAPEVGTKMSEGTGKAWEVTEGGVWLDCGG